MLQYAYHRKGTNAMQIKLTENIKKFRKQNGFTQEQLAEALGVTVGAVYKWEAGLSSPELKLMMEIADLFEISTDTLLGFDCQNGNADNRVERIMQCILENKPEEAVTEANKALKKYPNHFKTVYVSASAFRIKYLADKDEKSLEKANDLLEKAIALLYQNTDSSIDKVVIRKEIAVNYRLMGKTEFALDTFLKENPCGVNNSDIGYLYSVMLKKTDESRLFLFKSFVNELGNIFMTMMGMTFMYLRQNDSRCLETISWFIELIDGLKNTDKVTFTDEMKVIFLTQKAVCESRFGTKKDAKKDIKEAYLLARELDREQKHSSRGIRFLEDIEDIVGYTGIGSTATESIEIILYQYSEDIEEAEYVREVWKKLKNTETEC